MKTQRISSIDAMRGLVMILMVLDHVRDFFHETALTQSPTDLATAGPGLFATRWITHLCAPVFVFLTGVSAYLSFVRRGDRPAFRKHLLTRGVLLILMDLTLVSFGIWFDPKFQVILFNVLAAIGTGLIILALLLSLSARTLAFIGLAVIVLHGGVTFLLPEGSPLRIALTPLFGSTAFPLGVTTMIIGYPPIPWSGILLTGFGLGELFLRPATTGRQWLTIGLAALAAFVVIRLINGYGDPSPWQFMDRPGYTVLSFLNVTKYPPSLDFTLLFLGLMFILLPLMQPTNRFTGILSIYGKVPLFYFLTHWYLIHPLLLAFILAEGFAWSDLVFGFRFGRPETFTGYSLWVVYLVWAVTVMVLYPICRWYYRYKSAHPEKRWLRYL